MLLHLRLHSYLCRNEIEVPKLKSQGFEGIEPVQSADAVPSGKSMQKLPDLSLAKIVTVTIFVANE